MTITEMQEDLKRLGYQWIEHIYNDGIPGADCCLDISKGSDPTVFSAHEEDAGWGRFTRQYCWEEALRFAKSV